MLHLVFLSAEVKIQPKQNSFYIISQFNNSIPKCNLLRVLLTVKTLINSGIRAAATVLAIILLCLGLHSCVTVQLPMKPYIAQLV